MIDYGLERGIEIIPEIDVPGHSTIAIKAHNNFACVGKNVGWGKEFSYPLCLGNDSVLNYYTDIFNEIMELFPSKYIHVGADEADQPVGFLVPNVKQEFQPIISFPFQD